MLTHTERYIERGQKRVKKEKKGLTSGLGDVKLIGRV